MSWAKQLPDRRWRAFESEGSGAGRVQANAVGATRREATTRAKVKLAAKMRQAHLQPHSFTFGAYLDHWISHMRAGRASAHTIRVYESIVRCHVTKALSRTPLAELRPLPLQQMLDQRLSAGSPANSVRKEYKVLHAALAQAVRWRLITASPCDDVTPPPAERTEMKALDEDGAAALLASVSGTRFALAALIAVTTGLRRGELLALRWQDVDTEAATLRVARSAESSGGKVVMKEPKTRGSVRSVGLMAVTVSALAEHKRSQAADRLADGPRWHDHGLVLPAAHGEPWTPATFSSGWLRLGTGVRFHDLRHSHATLLLRAGTPVDVVAKRLGHATPSITLSTYSHVLEDADDAAVARLEGGLGVALGAE